MAVSDKTRKLLWGQSGNRCAICRCSLAADATPDDPVAIVGEECHIVAQSGGGPRASEIKPEKCDAEENLLLLCRTDHRRVDEQPGYFTIERLRAIKVAHETWVFLTLSEPRLPASEPHIASPNQASRQEPSSMERDVLRYIAKALRSNQAPSVGQLIDELEALRFRDYKEVTIIAELQALRKRHWIWWDEKLLRDAVIEWSPEHQAVLDAVDEQG